MEHTSIVTRCGQVGTLVVDIKNMQVLNFIQLFNINDTICDGYCWLPPPLPGHGVAPPPGGCGVWDPPPPLGVWGLGSETYCYLHSNCIMSK